MNRKINPSPVAALRKVLSNRSAIGRAGALLAMAAGLALACGPSGAEEQQSRLPESSLLQIPLGDVPGEGVSSSLKADVQIPNEGDPATIQRGKALFTAMNCVYCHSFGATGLVGPSLANHYWRYGGKPADVFKSIYEGRPKGMPAFGLVLPSQSIWNIVAYIHSLGGMIPTEKNVRQGDVPGGEVATGGRPAGGEPAHAAAGGTGGETRAPG
jgi:cytochrome c oxidase cbb3-type subunit 3